jgi:hypothetical protein
VEVQAVVDAVISPAAVAKEVQEGVGISIRARTTMEGVVVVKVAATPTTPGQSVKCVSKMDTLQIDVGIGSKKTSSPKRSTLEQP